MIKNILLLPLFFLFACSSNTQESDKEESLVSVKQKKGISAADIIRNPVTANKPIDTTNIAKFEFEETNHNFGTVDEGDKVRHAFKFKNVGTVPLIITHARSTCGCTVPKWPKNAIEPGKSGVIDVVFNTAKKRKIQRKPIIITSNAYPSVVKLFVEGYVTPDPNVEKKMMEALRKSAGK